MSAIDIVLCIILGVFILMLIVSMVGFFFPDKIYGYNPWRDWE